MQSGEKINNTDGPARATGWEYLDEKNIAKNESNINSKTGKERTFSEFDIYPKMPGETNEEYGARLRFMHEKMAEFEAAEQAKNSEEVADDAAAVPAEATDEEKYFASVHGQKELSAQEKYDQLEAKLDKAVSEGRMSEEHANRLLEKQLEKFDAEATGYRQDYEDSKQVGTLEEQKAYQEWLKRHDAENMENLKGRKIEVIEISDDEKDDGKKQNNAPLLDEQSDDVPLAPDAEPTIDSEDATKLENIGKITSSLNAYANDVAAKTRAEDEARARAEQEARARADNEGKFDVNTTTNEDSGDVDGNDTPKDDKVEADEKENIDVKNKLDIVQENKKNIIKWRLSVIGDMLKIIFSHKSKIKNKIDELDEQIAALEAEQKASQSRTERMIELETKMAEIDSEIAKLEQ